jgi:hypothetical protein
MSDTEPISRGRSEGEIAFSLYGSAVAVTTWYFEALSGGETPSLAALERAAQSLAAASANAAFAGVLTLASTARDDASRAVQSAMLALAAARRITRDPRALRRLALAALLVDSGRARLAGLESIDLSVFRDLPDALDALAPASSAALGVVSSTSPAMEGSAETAFEVAWLERPRLGPLYGGQLEPRFSSRLLRATRALFDEIAPRTTTGSVSPFEALRRLVQRSKKDDSVNRLLVEVIGVIPTGTIVELSSGEWAAVAPLPDRPRVRLLTTPDGSALERAPLVELGPDTRVIRVIEPAEARINVARAFFVFSPI